MFDRSVTDTTTSATVIQALTKNKRGRRDNASMRNPRKMHEEVDYLKTILRNLVICLGKPV